MAPTRSGRKEATKATKQRGRPPGNRNSATAKKPAPKPAAAKEKTRRKRKSKPQEDSRPSSQKKAGGRPPRERNEEPEDDADEIAVEKSERKKYVQLAPRTRRIAQEQIDTWPQIGPQVLEEIVGVLKDAKKDIVNTQRDEHKATTADETLSALVRMLARQLSDSRIPPHAKDIHFNIDKLTERYAQLFREVTTERHAKQLLNEQVKVAQHLLAKDQENLEQLKKNATKWRATWKRQEQDGRLHPLLQDLEDVEIQNDGPDDIGLKRSTVPDISLLDTPDPELAPLLEQLRRSLESMQGNYEQVAGIDEARRRAAAALDGVLFRHASARQYAAL
ncbi:hypothetical protein K458DRAFT_357757 [Lentithecium fluviatile CBS 122367]|uniref:CENP-Q, a CENPA-CAD centromere complex subunit-domain-containing protein n=1 Tax=Lentithecium fluviatile CBS 122367 TaxID=1168545 RepID=A0A6G1JF66_9PLEO|nr:hypothetical protein K458DRAFT_357757 [Lentithecium fluviatile CBS 122367]